jgi:hypothetical protein
VTLIPIYIWFLSFCIGKYCTNSSKVTDKKFEKSKKSPKLLQATVPLSQSFSCSTDCKLSPMLTSLSSIADKPRALNPKLRHNGTGGKVPSQSFTCYLENLILSLRQCQLPIYHYNLPQLYLLRSLQSYHIDQNKHVFS